VTFAIQLGLVLLISTVACWFLIRSASSMSLIAEPGEHRQHSLPTPMVGGLAIYLALFFGLVLIAKQYVLLLPCLLFMCVVGVVDDRYALPSWLRFLAQGLAAYLMIQFTGIQLLSLGFLVGGEQEVLLNRWSMPLTIFATVGVINAINMSDGLDGLAGSMVVLVLISLLILNSSLDRLIWISIAAICGFLFFNLRLFRAQAAAFLGDAGSMMLGLLLATLLIQHSQNPIGIWPVTALWLLAIPLIDAVAVLLVRPLHGKSPFLADNSHYHHQLLQRGFSVNGVLVITLLSQIIFIAIGITLFQLRVAEHIQLIMFLAVFAVYLVHLWSWMRRNRKRA